MWVLLLITFLTINPALAAYDGDYTPRVTTTKPPTTLFHWIERWQLNLWAEKIEQNNQKLLFPRKLKKESQFIHIWNSFENRHGVYTWIDPVLGSRGVLHERYSHMADLMVFEINPEAKAIRVISDGKIGNDYSQLFKDANINPSQVQLVEHITPQLHEWIILNPKAVKDFSADPRVTYPLVWIAMQPYLNDPKYQPPLSDIHFRYGPKFKDTVWANDPKHMYLAPKLAGVLTDLVNNFIYNPASPYFMKSIAEKNSYMDRFKKPLAPNMQRPLAKTCKETLSQDFNYSHFSKTINLYWTLKN